MNFLGLFASILWKGRRASSNIEDESGGGGGGGRKTLMGGGIGIILVLVISLLTGKNPLALMSQWQQDSAS